MFSPAAIESAARRVLSPFGWGFDEPRGASTLGRRLCQWAERVCAWNQRIDLTAARSVEELLDLLVADAAAVARHISPRASCVDVGSGAGAPGLALAVLLPEAKLTLVEPKTKRVAFLRHVIGVLELNDVRVERARSDALAGSQWEVAISRATLEPQAWLEEGLRLATEQVWVLLAQQEPPHAPDVTLLCDTSYEWPLTRVRRRAVGYIVPVQAQT